MMLASAYGDRAATDAALVAASEAMSRKDSEATIGHICEAMTRDPDRYLSYGLLGDLLRDSDHRRLAALLYDSALRRSDLPQRSAILGDLSPDVVELDRRVLQQKLRDSEGRHSAYVGPDSATNPRQTPNNP